MIGGGVFGSVIALKLAGSGFGVTVFERNKELLSGSTPKSVMRLHLGLHYPRDLGTAIQSRKGYSRFIEEFRGSVDLGFENFYGIAKKDSKVSTQEFIKFLEAAGIEFEKRNKSDLNDLGFASEKIDSLFSSPEGVIDVNHLRNDLRLRLSNADAEVVVETEISTAEYSNEEWLLNSDNGLEFGPYDYVIKATYGGDQLEISGTKTKAKEFEFHETLVLRANLGLRSFGMTIIDGDFLTVLPDAFQDTHLLYGPSLSVLRRATGHFAPKEFLESPTTSLNNALDSIIRRYRDWFPTAPEPSLINGMVALRTIERGVESSDRRVTEVMPIAPSMLSVLSGKIDHCLFAADECLNLILKENR